MRQYPLLHNDTQIGTVHIYREGMYCRIVCTCTDGLPPDSSIFVKNGDDHIELGKCIRNQDGIVLRRFIPEKVLGNGDLAFSIGPVESKKEFTVLNSQQAFSDIPLLPYGRFVSGPSGGGIIFK